jgi:hypothetical protein
MSDFFLRAIHEALLAHGLASEIAEDCVISQDGLRLEPRVFPRETSAANTSLLQLDVAIDSPLLEGGELLDSFAGMGESPEAAEKDAFHKFLIGSFHVVIEALTNHKCDHDQVEWEEWTGVAGKWRVCSGPLLTHGAPDSQLSPSYGSLLEKLTNLYSRQITPGPHWLRVFVCAMDHKLTGVEVLLDGETWDEAERVVYEHPWNYPASYQSLRHLIVALPI